ncbi:MAG: Ldh family oxidoreductase, partial [Alphaproteobacteria bacterium]
AERMRDFAQILHASPAVDPAGKVIVPGEIELAKMRRYQAEGVPVAEETLALLRRHASSAPT